MRARRQRAVAQAALKAADRADDRVSVDQLTRAAREFGGPQAENVPREDGGCLEDALGLLAGVAVGLLVIRRWLR